MYNIRLMAIVNALEYLLHQDGRVPLSEFPTILNFFEKFTSFANSATLKKTHLGSEKFYEYKHFKTYSVTI